MNIYRKLYEAVKEHSGLDDDQLAEVAEHGSEAGWSGFTYYKDTCVFYDQHKELIWEVLVDQADEFGVDPMQFISQFGVAKSVADVFMFENMMAWYGLETAAKKATEFREDDDDQNPDV